MCREEFTSTVRRRVECPGCHAACCTACLKRYLLTDASGGDPQCMNTECRRPMNGEFLAEHLPRTWRLNEYKRHRETVLLHRELAMLPASQVLLENYREANRLRAVMAANNAEAAELRARALELERQTEVAREEVLYMVRHKYTRRGRGATTAEAHRRQFIRACPVEGCRGFLSTAWKCGTCETRVCKDCGEPKGKCDDADADGGRPSGAAPGLGAPGAVPAGPGTQPGPAAPAPHVCDPDVAASHKLLQKDSRPCPKCAAMIFKVAGCFGRDVMVRMWDGSTKASQDVRVGDVLVGDDGEPRTVLHTFHGEAPMYRVDQKRGMSYEVNGKHSLVFKYSGEGVSTHGDRFKVRWLDRDDARFKSTVFDSHKEAEAFFGGLGLDPVVEMTVERYLELPETHALVGWKSDGPDKGLATGFTVTPVGLGEYFGWAVDGNRRFVLEDFTVVRNCDQMFCTQCHVTYSWKTGEILTRGTRHNPHYFEWVRRNGGEVPRQPGDERCGGMPSEYDVCNYVRVQRPGHNEYNEILDYVRTINHVGFVLTVAGRNAPDDVTANADLRLDYLLNKIDQDRWCRTLQQREKRRERKDAERHVHEMFRDAGTDIVASMLQGGRTLSKALEELRALKAFANDHLRAVGKRFNMTVTLIS